MAALESLDWLSVGVAVLIVVILARAVRGAFRGRRMLTVGNPEEWKHFEGRHRQLFERYVDLQEAQNRAFIRPLAEPSLRDLVVFYTGRVAVEDFQEILLLAGNGSGIAALKILRGMYERTVDGRYLSQAPDTEVDNFYHWHPVQKHKWTGDSSKQWVRTSSRSLGTRSS